jgi:hypothetical protein
MSLEFSGLLQERLDFERKDGEGGVLMGLCDAMKVLISCL